MIDLSGKVALVTGASRGIGKAIAIRLAEAGSDVVVNYLTSQQEAIRVAREIQELGRRAWVVKADVGEPDDVSALLEFITDEIGQLDIVVSNAATGGFRPLMETTPEQLSKAMAVNAFSLVTLTRGALSLLERSATGGKIVAISSQGAARAMANYATVGTAKAALESLVRQLALEVGPRGINVNAVRAGLVETDSTKRMPAAAAMFEARRAQSLTGARELSANDVANAVLFLSSPLSDQVQGETLVVDGGAGLPI